MENKNELQDVSLDDILSELHGIVGDDVPDVEPDAELQELLDMPELTITPVVVKETDIDQLLSETLAESSVPDDTTIMFTPVPEESSGIPAEESAKTDPALDGVTGVIPATKDPALEGSTVTFPAAAGDTVAIPTSSAGEATAPKSPEGTPSLGDTKVTSPIVFKPRSRLKELKKQLVSGPEKRYYELSEIGTGNLQLALLLNVIVVLVCIGVTTMFAMDMVPENRLRLVIFSQVLAMLVSGLLGSHLMIDSIADLLKGRFTVNTLLTITFSVCLVDSVFCLMNLRVPCCAAFSLEMTMALWARLQKRNTEMAQLDTMRKAVRLTGIVKVDDFFEGKDGILRKEGQVSDFMDTYDKPSTPEITQSIYAALSLLACIAIAGFTGYLHGFVVAVQIFATSLLVAVPATFFVSITRPMAILENRLHMVGTVLCGWAGVRDLVGKAVFPLKDQDLFPQGSIKFNGVKFYGDRDPDEVVSYAASLISVSDSGLVPVFQQLLKSRNCEQRKVDTFRNYGEGGIGGEVQGEPILLGTLSFLQDMGVEIPEGTMVSQAIYAAIDGQLCAVFAISYAKMRSAAAGLVSLCGYRKLTLVKLPGDFMLTEDFLRNRFSLKTRRFIFPTREAGVLLKHFHPNPEEPVLALTTREELISSAYAITGARALRQATRLGVTIHLIGGILGLAIMLVLGYLGSTELLTPTHVLLYQLIWAIPGLLVTEWTRVV